MPFNAQTFATQELPTFTQCLGLESVIAEASCSAPPLDMSQNYADVPDVEAASIAATAAEITGQGAAPAHIASAPSPDNFTP